MPLSLMTAVPRWFMQHYQMLTSWLRPASFGCRTTFNCFSLIWLNPPFDHAYGGHRVEIQFLQTATNWLMPGGVMAAGLPRRRGRRISNTRQHFAIYYENCSIVAFPEEHRQFREVIVFGHKRLRPQADQLASPSWESVCAREGFVYRIPPGSGPKVFQKIEPTEPELQRMPCPIASSWNGLPRN